MHRELASLIRLHGDTDRKYFPHVTADNKVCWVRSTTEITQLPPKLNQLRINITMKHMKNTIFFFILVNVRFTLTQQISATSWQLLDLHSTRLFCSGVPVSTTRLRVLIAFIALEMLEISLRKMCPSSHTTKSGPEESKKGVSVAARPGVETRSWWRCARLLYLDWPEHSSLPSSTPRCRCSWPVTGCGTSRTRLSEPRPLSATSARLWIGRTDAST